MCKDNNLKVEVVDMRNIVPQFQINSRSLVCFAFIDINIVL